MDYMQIFVPVLLTVLGIAGGIVALFVAVALTVIAVSVFQDARGIPWWGFILAALWLILIASAVFAAIGWALTR